MKIRIIIDQRIEHWGTSEWIWMYLEIVIRLSLNDFLRKSGRGQIFGKICKATFWTSPLLSKMNSIRLMSLSRMLMSSQRRKWSRKVKGYEKEKKLKGNRKSDFKREEEIKLYFCSRQGRSVNLTIDKSITSYWRKN